MSKVINCKLTRTDIQRAIHELQEYRDSLQTKVLKLQQRIADLIETEIRNGFNQSLGEQIVVKGDDKKFHADHWEKADVSVDRIDESQNVTLIVASGSQVCFIEFGAGVYFAANGNAGSSNHPKGKQFGFAIGEYGEGHGKRKVWSFMDDSGERKFTHGTPMTMPMYKAMNNHITEIYNMAREVFAE